MKSGQVRVRVNQDNSESLKRLADATGMLQVEIASMLLHAALAAIESDRDSVAFPVRFRVINPTSDRYLLLQERPEKTERPAKK